MPVYADDLENSGHRVRGIHNHDGAVAVSRACEVQDHTNTTAIQERQLAEIEHNVGSRGCPAQRLGQLPGRQYV